MKHVVDPAGDVDELAHVGPHQVEVVLTDEVRDVVRGPRDEVVEADHLVALRQEAFAEMRTEESGSAGYDCALRHVDLVPSFGLVVR